MPAFTLSAETANRLGILHALDFEKPLDAEEEEIVRRKGVNQATVERLLKHRIALGLVEHPATAAYLVRDYEELEGRVFEKKRFANGTKAGKHWYEYHPADIEDSCFPKREFCRPPLPGKSDSRWTLFGYCLLRVSLPATGSPDPSRVRRPVR